MEIKTILITQARIGSTRLPRKVLMEINGKSLLQIHLDRVKKCKKVSEVIVATTIKDSDDVIYEIVRKQGIGVYRGSESDVLDRFYQAVKDKKADWIVRLTSDCPLIDPDLVDKIISFAQKNNKDYCSNTLIENYPDGQDVEVFKFSALEKAWYNAKLLSEREHVTPFIRNNSDFKEGCIFTAINYPCNSDFSRIRMTVDEMKDYELIKVLIEKIGLEKTWFDYTDYIIKNDLTKINYNIIRNEGLIKSLKNDK